MLATPGSQGDAGYRQRGGSRCKQSLARLGVWGGGWGSISTCFSAPLTNEWTSQNFSVLSSRKPSLVLPSRDSWTWHVGHTQSCLLNEWMFIIKHIIHVIKCLVYRHTMVTYLISGNKKPGGGKHTSKSGIVLEKTLPVSVWWRGSQKEHWAGTVSLSLISHSVPEHAAVAHGILCLSFVICKMETALPSFTGFLRRQCGLWGPARSRFNS